MSYCRASRQNLVKFFVKPLVHDGLTTLLRPIQRAYECYTTATHCLQQLHDTFTSRSRWWARLIQPKFTSRESREGRERRRESYRKQPTCQLFAPTCFTTFHDAAISHDFPTNDTTNNTTHFSTGFRRLFDKTQLSTTQNREIVDPSWCLSYLV